jgi:hypothetical protein
MRSPLIWRRNGVDRARYEQVIDQRDEARTEAADHVCKIVELCGEIDALREQHAAARKRLAAYGHRRTVSDVLVEHDVHRKALADTLGDQKRHLNWDQLIAEVGRLNTAAGEWMADHEAEKKRADQLQTRLDYALGLNRAAVEDGKNWQARRTDKPHPAKETS